MFKLSAQNVADGAISGTTYLAVSAFFSNLLTNLLIALAVTILTGVIIPLVKFASKKIIEKIKASKQLDDETKTAVTKATADAGTEIADAAQAAANELKEVKK